MIKAVFNNGDAIFCINWCYDMLFHREKNLKVFQRITSILHLCGAHWIKQCVNKIKKIKKYKNDEKKNKIQQKVCIFVFALLQNVETIELFIEIFIHSYNLFCVEFLYTEIRKSGQIIKQLLEERDLTYFTIRKDKDLFDADENDLDIRESKEAECGYPDDNKFNEDDLITSSLFTKKFKQV